MQCRIKYFITKLINSMENLREIIKTKNIYLRLYI